MQVLLLEHRGHLDLRQLELFFEQPDYQICKGPKDAMQTLDAMLFNTTRRELHISRAPVYTRRWTKIEFGAV
jgi:hypothetical protein